MTTVSTTRTATASPTVRWRLSGGWRRAVLLLHIMAAGVWLGLDVVMAILVVAAVRTDSAGTRGYALQALQLLTVWPMFTAAVVSLLTGVLLGLGSKYGLVRYWWVLVKLVLNLVLMVLVLVALPGGVERVADVGRDLSAGVSREFVVGDMAFPPIVSTTALLVAFVLSVFKPWGRIRRKPVRAGGPPRSTGQDLTMEERAVRSAILDRAARLEAASGLSVGPLPDTENRDGAAPYFKVEAEEIVYRARERGQLLFEHRTTSLDEFLRWVFDGVTWQMATQWELESRVPGQDGRRRWFPKWIELMGLLSPQWGEMTRRKVEEILADSPYHDRP